MPARILAFAGSLRRDSFNRRLVSVAVGGARAAGAEVMEIDLKDYPLPVYAGDLEASEGLPESALRLKAIMKDHDGFLISAPEYNSSITAALKNAIDWASRPHEDEPSLVCFRGKVAGLMAASPGALGGWLATLARRRAADHHRRAHRMAALPDEIPAPEGPGAEAGEALAAIREMPEAYRETLLMRLVEGQTGPEIASATGLTPGSVRVNLHRGMKLLRARLAGEGSR